MSISVAPKASFTNIQSSVLPGQTCAFDLGTISLQWRNAFLNGYLSLLGSEAGAVERRLQEKVGDVQLVNSANTLLRSLNTDIAPTTLTPTSVATIGTSTSYARGDHIHGASGFSTLALNGVPPVVDASGQVAGVAVTASRSDHKHQFANPITGTVNLGTQLLQWNGGDVEFSRTAAGILRLTTTSATTLVSLSLLGTEVGATERRIRENAAAVEVTDATPTVLRSLLLDVVPSTLTSSSVATIGTSTGYSRGDHIHGMTGFLALNGVPAVVDAGGQTAGVATTASRSDHKHQFANPITGTVNLGTQLLQWNGGDVEFSRTAAGILRLTTTSATTLVSLALLGTEVGAAERRIRENAANVEITDATPTVLAQLSPLSALTPTAVDIPAGTAGTSVQISRADHTHNLADPLTGGLSVVIASGSTWQIFPTSIAANPKWRVDADGTINWGPGSASVLDMTLGRQSAGILRLSRQAGTGVAGFEVIGTEASAAVRRYTENAGRAVIQDSAGTHLNDIERTRLTFHTPVTSVAAGTVVTDTEFFVPSGKTVKAWYAAWVGSTAPAATTFLEVINVNSGVFVIQEDTAANGSAGDPSTNGTLGTNASTGQLYAVRRDNTSAKSAFSFGGVVEISIE